MAKDTELSILDCLDSTVRDLLEANTGIVSLCRELLAKDRDKYADICKRILDQAEIVHKATMELNQLEIKLHKVYIE